MSLLGFSASDLVSILQVGISGVAFLFLAMSYNLLRKEQEREKEPRDKILSSIKQFSMFSFAFAILVAGVGVYDAQSLPNNTISASCKASLERAELISTDRSIHTIDTIHELLENTIADCKQ